MWADKQVSSALQKMGKFFNIPSSCSLSIRLTIAWITATSREVSTTQAQAKPEVRRVEGKRTLLHGQILVGMRLHSYTALSAAGVICTTRRSTPNATARHLASADPQTASPIRHLSFWTERQQRKWRIRSSRFKKKILLLYGRTRLAEGLALRV